MSQEVKVVTISMVGIPDHYFFCYRRFKLREPTENAMIITEQLVLVVSG